MLHIILFQPDIPQNTGNIGRLCAVSKSRLHLIYPLGFDITDKHLKRSGMDYWHSLDIRHHATWNDFINHPEGPKRLWLFSTKAQKSFWQATFAPNDGLLFGKETAGAPDWLHDYVGDEQRIYINQFDTSLRSLNLATAVGIATYEALRQMHATDYFNHG